MQTQFSDLGRHVISWLLWVSGETRTTSKLGTKLVTTRRTSLLFCVSIGAGCGVILGGLLMGGIALLSDRPFAESTLGFVISLAVLAFAGAMHGVQAWRETPKGDHGASDA